MGMSKQEMFKLIAQKLREHGAIKVAIFGSYARGEQTRESDIDIIVEFSKTKSLLKLVRIERELSETLSVKVDLLTTKSISPYIKDRVAEEMVVIHG